MTDITPLRTFVAEATRVVERHHGEEAASVAAIKALLADLVAKGDWLPAEFAVPHAQYYRQYLLYGDPLDRLSVVSFVWGSGQTTPVHDHRTWGVVGVLRGAEIGVNYTKNPDGSLRASEPVRLNPGDVIAVSPDIGDIHTIANACDDQVSISIHVYGGNIGRIHRAVIDPATGAEKEFISGYSNTTIPNLWSELAVA
jgi:predicted metal-dependent enzyme (double-stranded beta helix superfamily)